MIFGRTEEEKRTRFREWWRANKDVVHTSFAFFPVRLENKSWCWLQNYNWKYSLHWDWWFDYIKDWTGFYKIKFIKEEGDA
jgi:hypothetical protein